jgi:hypothetical protein
VIGCTGNNKDFYSDTVCKRKGLKALASQVTGRKMITLSRAQQQITKKSRCEKEKERLL